MQEVKYYVPKIEEFYVGFECEINDIKLNKPSTFKGGKFEDNWVKYKFDGRPLKWLQGYHSDISFFEIDLERIRVKYLDKEDIESLIELYQIPGDSFEWEWLFDYGSVTFNKNSTVSELEIFGTIFQVNNKTELKNLLKYLKIEHK